MPLVRFVSLLVGLAALAAPAAAVEGLVVKKSPHSVPVTMDRLEKAVGDAGATVVARVDHAAAARKGGQALRPTILLIFGNPKAGTPLMQAAPTIGIDLPMKALAWEDDKGQVWVGYVSPAILARRHGVTGKGDIVEALTKALERFTDAATSP